MVLLNHCQILLSHPDSGQLSSAIYLHLDHVLQVSLLRLEAVAAATAGVASAAAARFDMAAPA